MAFLFVEFMSWLRRSFYLVSCLFCSMSLFKEIFASFVFDRISDIKSVPLDYTDLFRRVDVLSLFSWNVLLLMEAPDWFKVSTTGNCANELLMFSSKVYLNFSYSFFNEVSFISNLVYYSLFFFISSLSSYSLASLSEMFLAF